MDPSRSYELNRALGSQDISRLLYNPKIHYRIHKRPKLVSILSPMNLVHTYPFSLRSISMSSSRLCLGKHGNDISHHYNAYTIFHEQEVRFLKIRRSLKKNLRGFSPQANYTDRPTAACRRS
jgi:hypothetical protein